MRTQKLIGNKCYLSPILIEDAPQYYEWLNDMHLSIYLRTFPRIITLEQEKQVLSQLAQDQYILAIIDKTSDTLLGNCGLSEVDFVNRTAEYGIFIGETSYRHQGYGLEATQLMMDFAFQALNLNSIWVKVYSFNEASIGMFQKCGFQLNGRRREARIIGDKKYDEILLDLLASEYESVYLKNILS